MSKCWICEREYVGAECPDCGPPMPWGPTPEELRGEVLTKTLWNAINTGDLEKITSLLGPKHGSR